MEHVIIPLGERHAPHNWEFADAAARASEVITDETLVGALALQLDDGSYWRLSAVSPATWVLGPRGAKGDTGDQGIQGEKGDTGDQGEQGIQGIAGEGFAAGGTSGQVVRKASNTDFDFEYHTLVKADVGLGNVDNTTDAGKPVSTPQQAALDLKAPLASPTFTGTVGGVTKAMVGLGSADDTSDAGKPVSTAQQAALDLKANLASPALTGTPTVPTAASGTNTTQAASTAFVHGAVADLVASSPAALDTLNELAAALGNDPSFAATVSTAIGLKEATANKDVSGGYVGLTALKINFWNFAATFKSFFINTNTAARTYTFQDRNGTVADDTDLGFKAPIANPTFTGTVSGITKAMVGLGNADDTSDTGKPVSTAQQAALDLKAALASPTFTGTLSAAAAILSGLLTLSNGQIKFPATQNPSSDANTIDDFEKGTCTFTDGSGAGITFTSSAGVYVKIGPFVFVSGRVVYPSTVDISAAVFNGMPFVCGVSGMPQYNAQGVVSTSGTATRIAVDRGSSSIYLFVSGSTEATNAGQSLKTLDFSIMHMTA